METKNKGLGNYVISEKAFKEIATIACTNIKNVFPYKKDKDIAECKFNKNKELTVNLSIRVKKGIDIVKLCTKIQDEVKENKAYLNTEMIHNSIEKNRTIIVTCPHCGKEFPFNA